VPRLLLLLLLSKVRVELLRVGVAVVVVVVVAARLLNCMCIQRVVDALVDAVTHL
jgi:hypothetical protein